MRNSGLVVFLEEGSALLLELTGLHLQRLAKRVVAGDKELIPPMEPFNKRPRWHEVELAAFASIARPAR
jgi:hypothetical protein